jgi:hypothetical protein
MNKGKKSEIFLGDGLNFTIETSKIVNTYERLVIFRDGRKLPVELDIKIEANFENIPMELHQTFINMITARYGGAIRMHDNTSPFSFSTKVKKKWYEFWKN